MLEIEYSFLGMLVLARCYTIIPPLSAFFVFPFLRQSLAGLELAM